MAAIQKPNVLMVYIEPTPYILGLIKAIESLNQLNVNVQFLEENVSQQWDIQNEKSWKSFPKSKWKKWHTAMRVISQSKYDIIHLAGWGHRFLLFFLLLAKIRGLPIAIETDTPLPHYIRFSKRITKKIVYPLLFRLIDLIPSDHQCSFSNTLEGSRMG